MQYIDGTYFGKSTEQKPTDIKEPAFWYNIDNADSHKVYAFEVDSQQWIPQD